MLRRHHRRDPSFYLAWAGALVVSWALVIAAGYGFTALVAYMLRS